VIHLEADDYNMGGGSSINPKDLVPSDLGVDNENIEGAPDLAGNTFEHIRRMSELQAEEATRDPRKASLCGRLVLRISRALVHLWSRSSDR
jgi:hypothetical protein